jgi:hypothetical protein
MAVDIVAHKFGSKFLVTFATFDPGACVDAVDRLSALIFISGYRGGLYAKTRRRELSCGPSRFPEAGRGQPTRRRARNLSVAAAKRSSEARTHRLWRNLLDDTLELHDPVPDTNPDDSHNEVVSTPPPCTNSSETQFGALRYCSGRIVERQLHL